MASSSLLRLALLSSVVFFACAHRQHRLGDPADGNPSCKSTSDCPWGYECASARCFESECHDDDPKGPLGVKPCASGECQYDGGDDLEHGNGVCAAVPLQ